MGRILWEDSIQQDLCDTGMYLGVSAKPELFREKPKTVEKDITYAKRFAELVSDCSCVCGRMGYRPARKFAYRVVIDRLGQMI